jgi:hypothetical protein
MAENDDLLDELLISKRGYSHILYDEALHLINMIATDFADIVRIDSIG